MKNRMKKQLRKMKITMMKMTAAKKKRRKKNNIKSSWKFHLRADSRDLMSSSDKVLLKLCIEEWIMILEGK